MRHFNSAHLLSSRMLTVCSNDAGSVELLAHNPHYAIHGQRFIDVDQSKRAIKDVAEVEKLLCAAYPLNSHL
jgi:hypothetical protein